MHKKNKWNSPRPGARKPPDFASIPVIAWHLRCGNIQVVNGHCEPNSNHLQSMKQETADMIQVLCQVINEEAETKSLQPVTLQKLIDHYDELENELEVEKEM